MRAVDIISKKRDHLELSRQEIEFFVEGYTHGDVPDYQASAWAMAVLLNGMTDQETTDLTLAMAHSGEVMDLSQVVPLAVDKHSTGGVGDKTTLVVEPLVAACGLPVGKMSGRGLGFSGGTLDKIESIPGYRTNLSPQEFMQQLGKIGVVLTGQSANLAPADGKLYALRDVTGTIQSIPLIAASVMSKKIAAGAQAIVLDVKVGSGAFMKTLEDAERLARLMVAIGKLAGRRVVALLAEMNQPLGNAVGNALELREAIETLHGRGPADFREHCLIIASHMMVLGEKAGSLEDARGLLEKALAERRGWEKFRQLVIAQGGDVTAVDDPRKLPTAALTQVVLAQQDGIIGGIHAQEIGETACDLGAGRLSKGDGLDLSVGLVIHRKVGEVVKKGEPLFTIHAKDASQINRTTERTLAAYTWSRTPVSPPPLFYGVIS